MLLHLVTDLRQDELIARLHSALAAALAAGGIAVIGRWLFSTRAGLLAGLMFGFLPVVSRYAQEARSYAIISAVAYDLRLTCCCGRWLRPPPGLVGSPGTH
jgi:mannosyltransferase